MRLDQGSISTLLTGLVEGGYIKIAKIATGFGGPGPKQIYELQSRTSITCRDTALFLLELAESERVHDEQMVDLRVLLPALERSEKLRYLTQADFEGCPTYAGKIAELAIAGEYVERLGQHYVRPRFRLLLERKYLTLLVDGPKLTELSSRRFSRDRKQWERNLE